MPIRGIEYNPDFAFHPGSTLSEKLEELELSLQDFAIQIGVEKHVIVDIVEEKENGIVTPDLAEAFEKSLKIPAHFWLRKQNRYNEFVARQQLTKTTA